VNIASRLCDKALDGQVLLTQRAYIDVESQVRADLLGTWQLKGVKDGIEVYSVLGLGESAA
jgi:class 3 adenylate cyclase